jgi:hypothetical protein
MPRSTTDKTTPVSIRIETVDLRRIDALYSVSGVHGHIGRIIREGTHLKIFLEEIERERYPSNSLLREAIHTLRVAIDRRDRGEDDQGSKQKSSSTSAEEEERERKGSELITSTTEATS